MNERTLEIIEMIRHAQHDLPVFRSSMAVAEEIKRTKNRVSFLEDEVLVSHEKSRLELEKRLKVVKTKDRIQIRKEISAISKEIETIAIKIELLQLKLQFFLQTQQLMKAAERSHELTTLIAKDDSSRIPELMEELNKREFEKMSPKEQSDYIAELSKYARMTSHEPFEMPDLEKLSEE